MAKVLIAIPCMESVPVQFAHSLATLSKVGECVVAMQSGSLVYTSRENLAMQAIKLGADYIFWLDSDMVFNADVLQRLLADIEKVGDGAIVTGIYYRRVAPFSPVIYSKLDINDGKASWVECTEIPGEMFEVEGCGFGCVLAPTTAFVDVVSKFGTMFNPINGTGEDLAFCWRARQCGWKFIADPSIPLGHCAHYIVTRDAWEGFNEYSKDGHNNE